jgi:hypothetical protein
MSKVFVSLVISLLATPRRMQTSAARPPSDRKKSTTTGMPGI